MPSLDTLIHNGRCFKLPSTAPVVSVLHDALPGQSGVHSTLAVIEADLPLPLLALEAMPMDGRMLM